MYTLLERIKIRLRQFEMNGSEVVFTKLNENIILEELIDKAKKDIADYRHYPDSYTPEKIDEDISNNYSALLIDLVLYDYSTEGADFESSHSENGVNRTYISRNSILGKVIPFVKILV